MTNLFTTSFSTLCIALGLPFVQSSLSESVANHNFRQTVQTIADSTSGSGIIATQAKPQLVSNQFSFTEGPAVDKKGNVYFTDQPNNKIWKYDTEGKLSVFMENSGRSNGMYFDQKGNLISCADENNQLWSISPQGKVTVLLKDFQGHTFNGPNDVWVDKSGGIYFTDPYYQRPYWKRQSPDPNLGGEKLYYLPKGASAAILLDDTFKQPNGLIGTADGKILYVADIGDNKTYKYEIAGNGVLKNRQLFVNQGSDGMTIDNQGNVYLTGNGVTVYNKEGQKIEHIPIQAKWTANVCFGGKEKNLLFITASESVYTLKMQVKGVQ
ncbi:SMP-30/gluconolactonase/LRE family protein [Cytophagaceae bacterium DM2B3-1]|uniref:SMP-30/gluconolactonase/LRE family protein n=2 Tax=Xanthocytophaga flava TaxID=3048013 RepID=A0ABT7CYL7_9BACT|nr:SMP-30/gluconolactonase/LRE family protein [Xanthocytophaga flavus]